MKITDVRVWFVEGVRSNWTLLKVYTDEGHTGVGEATNWPGSPIIEAAAVRAKGFTGLKLDPFAHTRYLYGDHLATDRGLTVQARERAVAICRAVREAVGPETDIMIETHALLNFRTAVEMASRLAELYISTLASAHVCAAIPNFFRQELFYTDVPWRDTVMDRPLEIRDGHLVLPDRPGLGVDLVEEEMERHPGVRNPRPGFYV